MPTVVRDESTLKSVRIDMRTVILVDKNTDEQNLIERWHAKHG